MKAVVLIALLLLAGCTTVKPTPKVELPANLIQPCPAALIKVEGLTGKDLLRNIKENAKIYHTCKDMHDKLIEAVSPNGASEK